MLIIGLTGGSGVGKGTVASILKNDGYFHIDADDVADDILNNCDLCKNEIEKAFPGTVANGKVDRKSLAQIVFLSEEQLSKLNAITHKYIIEKINDIIKIQAENGVERIILDAAAMYESGADAICDYVIAVAAERKKRISRIIERDRLTLKEAETRVDGQHDDEYFSNKADYIIYNNGEFDELYSNVESIMISIKNKEQDSE